MASALVDCSTVEAAPYHASTDAGLLGCVRRWWAKHPGSTTLTVDGVTIKPSGYLVGASPFDFKFPPRNNLLGVRGHTRGRAAIYGITAMIKPLSRGSHTLVGSSEFRHDGPPTRITYRLTVG